MHLALRLAERASLVGVWFGGTLVIAAAALIGVDVAMRKFLNLSIGGADELSGYALAIGTTWSLGFTLLHRAHIRIDSLYVKFPEPLRALLDVAGLAGFIAIFGLIAWYGWGMAADSASMDARSLSRLSTPLAIPQFLWFAGLVMFLCIAATLLANAVWSLARGDFAGVQRIAGSRSIKEEIADELPVGQPGAGA
jgi:TRAP-type C4-dicarboxylate transport system permease small subunit